MKLKLSKSLIKSFKMKNLEAVQVEVRSRNKIAINRGWFEGVSDVKCRLLANLMKSWYDHNGTLWTMRSYLIKYNRVEYIKAVESLKRYNGLSFDDRNGDNMDVFNFFHYRANGIQHNYTSYDGHLPRNQYTNAVK